MKEEIREEVIQKLDEVRTAIKEEQDRLERDTEGGSGFKMLQLSRAVIKVNEVINDLTWR